MVPVRIKICGITNHADAALAVELGADALGFNFYPASRRYIAPAAALPIIQGLPPLVEVVALFVNEAVEQMLATAERWQATRTLQWHGDAPQLPPPWPWRFVPAFAVADREGLKRVELYLAGCREGGVLPAAVLVDGQLPGHYGGTGRTVPWDVLADFQPGVPLILAGGLTPENVAEAVRKVRPYAVDVASGVESAPGVKDADKMRRFIENARAAL